MAVEWPGWLASLSSGFSLFVFAPPDIFGLFPDVDGEKEAKLAMKAFSVDMDLITLFSLNRFTLPKYII